jgi:hypothetical protein
MKHLLNNLDSEEKRNILEQHTGGINLSINNFDKLVNNKLGSVDPLINEDNIGGGGFGSGGLGTGYHKGIKNIGVQQTFNFDKTKMKTGSDDIDKTNPEYYKLVTQLETILKNNQITGPINVNVTGGASAVGSSKGFDNNALAKRRAEKLVTQIKSDVPGLDKKFNFNITAKVGKATKANSPEAMDEQFVKVTFDYSDIQKIRTNIEIDNTAVALNRPLDLGNNIVGGGKTKRVCVKIPENLVGQYKIMLREFKTKNGLKDLPFGVYDV